MVLQTLSPPLSALPLQPDLRPQLCNLLHLVAPPLPFLKRNFLGLTSRAHQPLPRTVPEKSCAGVALLLRGAT